jgi:raffinose/stachyose/melibiose transport system substrate-binding protein
MRKGFRSVSIVMAVAALFVSLLLVTTGCGLGKPVVVKTMGYGTEANQEGQTWVRLVDAFEKANPKIDIDYEMLYDEAYHQKVTARLASGEIPHLAYMGADARWGAPWKEASQQWDHRTYMDAKYYDMNLIPAHGPNGEIYEIPLGTSNICTVLYMNKTLVESLGFSQPTTYEDLVAMVPAAKKAGIEVVSIDGADGWAWGSCYMSAIIARLSGDPKWIEKAVEGGEAKFTDQVFVDSLAIISRMIKDGVISAKSTLVDYGANATIYSTGKALFMVQGQWIADSIADPAIKENTVLMAWPALPGEQAAMAGSVAAAPSVGYGITQEGAKEAKVRDAALKFLKAFNSVEEVTLRLRNGAIVAPVLMNFQVPDDLPNVVKQKVILANAAKETQVIDSFLSGAPNDALNAGMQKIAAGTSTPEKVAAEVETLVRK